TRKRMQVKSGKTNSKKDAEKSKSGKTPTTPNSKKEDAAEKSVSARPSKMEETSEENRAQSSYVKAKILYQQYMDYMDLEKGSIIDWLDGIIQK
ncbi:hypothetical protein PMAYCL1PPCAC_04134, partial [Pristionchus mayeri]